MAPKNRCRAAYPLRQEQPEQAFGGTIFQEHLATSKREATAEEDRRKEL